MLWTPGGRTEPACHLVPASSPPMRQPPSSAHACCMGLGTVSRSGQVLAPLVGLLGDTGNCDGDYRIGVTGVRWHGK